MPINLLFHDTRLEGRTPSSIPGITMIEVGAATPISEFFSRVISESDGNGGVETLSIMAHGAEIGARDSWAIMFCQEFISYQNVHLFGDLRGKVERIVLYVCYAAETEVTGGDGDELCSQMALQANAYVTAARDHQLYVGGMFGEIDFGGWEGTVVLYDRDGTVIEERHYPRAYRGSDGEIHDPRSEPNPLPGEGEDYYSIVPPRRTMRSTDDPRTGIP